VTVVLAPLPGRVVALADVPDPVFAQQMVGSGVAIEPARGQGPLTVVAPISGKILKLHPHAFVIFGEKATGVLVHIGIDTVKLEGDGFTLIAAEGDTVDHYVSDHGGKCGGSVRLLGPPDRNADGKDQRQPGKHGLTGSGNHRCRALEGTEPAEQVVLAESQKDAGCRENGNGQHQTSTVALYAGE
jgi:glucose-specific phosphotransferase system IIA component